MRVSTADRLNEYMEKYNLRQIDLVTKCLPYCRKHGISINKSAISRYVKGERKPTTDNLIMLAQVLHVSEEWLAGYDVPMERSAEDIDLDNAAILADAASDPELIEMLQKVQQLDAPDRKKVCGYIDAIYDLSFSSEDKASEEE